METVAKPGTCIPGMPLPLQPRESLLGANGGVLDDRMRVFKLGDQHVGARQRTHGCCACPSYRLSSTAVPYVLATALAEALPALGIVELQKAVHERTLKVGQVVGIEQKFDFRRAKERDKAGDKPVDFRAQLNTDSAIVLSGSFNSIRFTAASASGNLTGCKPAYLVGTITGSDRDRIELRPAFVGIRSFIEEEEPSGYGVTSNRRIYPSQVDQFEGVDFRSLVGTEDLKALLEVPEETVKITFAAMIGEVMSIRTGVASGPTSTPHACRLRGGNYPAPGYSRGRGIRTL